MLDEIYFATKAAYEEGYENAQQEAGEMMIRRERERDDALAEALEQARLLGMSAEREAELLAQLAAERALADRLAGVLFGCTSRDQNDAYDAWEEARRE